MYEIATFNCLLLGYHLWDRKDGCEWCILFLCYSVVAVKINFVPSIVQCGIVLICCCFVAVMFIVDISGSGISMPLGIPLDVITVMCITSLTLLVRH